jgi:hypothetical protein
MREKKAVSVTSANDLQCMLSGFGNADFAHSCGAHELCYLVTDRLANAIVNHAAGGLCDQAVHAPLAAVLFVAGTAREQAVDRGA